MRPTSSSSYRSLSLLTLVLLTASCAVDAQQADKIISQAIKAQGGRNNLAKIRSMTFEGTFANPEGTPGTFTLYVKAPNRYYSELLVNDHPLIEAYNGKSAWHQDESGDAATLLGAASTELESAAQYFNSHLLDLKKAKIGVAYIGHGQVSGKDALQVELTTVTGLKRELFFAADNHLLLRDTSQLDGATEDLIYSDYRPENGVQLPHAILLHRGAATYAITLAQATVNGPVGERVFDFPRKGQVQLLDLKALFKEIDENQKAIDKLKENYAGTRTEEETEYENDGRVKKHEVNQYTFFYLNGDEISTLIKKDGKALSTEEQEKENQKTQKEIQGIEKRQSLKEAKEAKVDKEEKEEDKASDSDDPGIEIFLRVCQFVNPRRERFRGQNVLVFDFEPNPDFKAHKLAEKVVQKLAGVIWIDEKAHAVARLEAYFVGDMKFAGGLLANLQKGTSFVQEQEFVNDEVWLPTYQEAHVGVRFLVVKGIKINVVTHYSDYKKFNVETLSTIGKPNESLQH